HRSAGLARAGPAPARLARGATDDPVGRRAAALASVARHRADVAPALPGEAGPRRLQAVAAQHRAPRGHPRGGGRAAAGGARGARASRHQPRRPPHRDGEPMTTVAERVQPYLAPISEAAPAGQPAKFDPRYERVVNEIAKLDAPAGGAVD